jgi:hypothetical protein
MLCQRASAIDEHFASRLAFLLECMCVDPHGHFDAACALLDEYKGEWEKVNPSPPTFMGEPVLIPRVSGEGRQVGQQERTQLRNYVGDEMITETQNLKATSAALEQPEPAAPTVVEPDVPAANFGNMEPVAWRTDVNIQRQVKFSIGNQTFTLAYECEDDDHAEWVRQMLHMALAKLAAHPPRMALTDEQIAAIDWKAGETLHDFARAIERAHGIGGEHE